MTTKEVIQTGLDRLLNAEQLEALRDAYNACVERGDFAEEEQEYRQGKAVLDRKLKADQRKSLEKAEKLQSENLRFAARFGFQSGLYVGFQRHFVAEESRRFHLDSILFSRLDELPGMRLQAEYFTRNEQCMKIMGQLDTELPEELCSHVVSIDLAWEQRIHFAATREFYWGYRTALMVLDAIVPHAETKLLADTLQLEHNLGMIECVDEWERRLQRERRSDHRNPAPAPSREV